MVRLLVTVAGAILAVWGVALVHQLGHYLAGWRIVGIPRGELKLESLLVPRAIALREGTDREASANSESDRRWVTPKRFERFRDAYERHDPAYENFERYVTGGEIVQVLVLVPVAVVLALAGLQTPAGILLGASVGTTLVFLGVDAIRTHRSAEPSGDYSALWPISKRLPALLLVAFLFVHLGALYFVVS